MSATLPSRTRSTQSHRDSRLAVDARAVMRIKDLQLRARVIVEGFFNGLHRSPFHGFSAEFSEYRQYSPGDDTRYLDWRLFARSDRYYIKRFEDETNRRCYLLVDLSRSMTYGTVGYSKADFARTLAATFAYYLTLQRDCVGVMTYDAEVREFLPARHRVGHLKNLFGILARSEQGDGTNTEAALEQIASRIKKRGLVVLLSDFLSPAERLRRPLSYLRSRGHEVFALGLLDPSELALDVSTPTLMRDLEDGQSMYVDPPVARAEYLERLNEHQALLKEICVGQGIDLTWMSTEDSLELALYHWLAHQIQRAGGTAITRYPRTPGGSAP